MLKNKSLIAILYLLLTMTCTSTLVLANTADEPEEWDLISYFFTVPSLAALVVVSTQFVKKNFKLEDDWAQYASFVIGLVWSCIGFFFGYGIFVGVEWYYIFIYGMASALIANGLFDWNLIKAILVFAKLKTGETK